MTVRASTTQFILWIGPNGAQYVMPYNYVSVWNDQYNQAMLAQQQCENISALISPKAITNCDDGSPTNSSGERFLSKGVKSRKGKQGFRLTKQPVRGILIEESNNTTG
jgi:hypothetical protein